MRICSSCGKGRRVGKNVSHANNKTQKIWEANIQRVRVVIDGENRRVYACTRCLRSGKLQKPGLRKHVAVAQPAAS